MSGIVDATLTTEAFGTMEVRVAAAPRWGTVGGGLDLPVVLWVRSGVPDTGRLVVEGTVFVVEYERFRVEAHGEARANLQVDVLGTRLAGDVVARVDPGLVIGAAWIGARVGWEQPLATAVWTSAYTRGAFEGSGTEARDGVIGPELGRAVLGVGASGAVGGRWRIHGAIDGILSPGALGLDVAEAVVVGQWPVRVEVGARVELP